MGEQTAKAPGLNRAKTYQLVLFPLNNGATNVYYVLVLSYIATFGSKVLALSMIFASVMVTGMRLFDAITDPIIGALMDRTNGKFGKFRPFMVIGNLIMAASILVLYCLTPLIPASSMGLRYAAFVALYAVWVIGYTFQTSCTRSGQTVLTNDPKQRPLFTIFNTVGSLLGMGAMQFFAPILAKNYEGGYASAGFFRTLAPVGIVISILLTILAIIGIWEKDQPKYFGIGGEVSEKVKLHEYVQIIKNNNPMQRLMVAGAGCKLALSIATNTTVLCMLYGCMMGNYDGLYLPMMVLGYVFSVPFFLLTVRTSQKEGQKASLMKYVSVAFICYIGVLACEKIAIDPEETSGQLFDRVTAVGARVLCETLPAIEAGTLKAEPQAHENASVAPMLSKEMAQFHLTDSADHIHNWVRGMNPWPGAWFVTAGGRKLKVTECRVAESHGEAAGTVLATKPLTVACGEGAVQLLHVVPEGKKPMDGTSFAAGLRLRAGDSL